jgi:hypothetical protein
MKQEHVLQAVRVALAADVPVLVWGEPGVGKTASIKALADGLGWPVEIVLASLREPSDFAGLPVVVDGDMRFAPPDWAKRLSGHDRAICFFDEISTAAPSVQKALLRVVHDRVVGDLDLGTGVRMIAAANPADIAAGGWDLTAPLANRFCHLEWGVDPGVVADGLAGRWPDVAFVDLPDDWTSGMARTSRMVAAFLRARPQFAHQRPDAAEKAGRGWPSPRSWEATIRVLAAADAAHIDPAARFGLLAGLVGEGVAVEFSTYERDLDLPDPEALLKKPERYERPARDDQIHAVVGAVADAVLTDPTPERWVRGIEVFVRIAELGNLDIAAGGVRRIAAHRPDGAMPPDGLTVFGDILRSIGALV